MIHKEKGSIGMAVLILLCVLAVAGISMTAAVSRIGRETESYRRGIQASYAAEGGAVWGLSFLKKYGIPAEKKWEISLDENQKAEIYFLPPQGENISSDEGGILLSKGIEKTSGTARYVKLSFSAVRKESVFLVTVHQAESEP